MSERTYPAQCRFTEEELKFIDSLAGNRRPPASRSQIISHLVRTCEEYRVAKSLVRPARKTAKR